MRHKMPRRRTRNGFTLVEVGVATFIITVVALAGFAYYSSARMAEINEWHEQNALFLSEREVESWQAGGYTALNGFGSGDCGPTNFLPYGYQFGNADPDWIVASRYKPVTLDGFDYRIRARNLFNEAVPAGTPTNHYVHETWNNGTGDVDYYYRQVVVVVQWGGFSGTSSDKDLTQETRMAR